MLGLCVCLSACTVSDVSDIEKLIDQTAGELQKKETVLSNQEMFPAGNSVSDWVAMTLAFSGRKDAYNDYLHHLREYVGETYEEEGYLHRIKATEYHRIALTMLALGGNPDSVEYNGRVIDLIADGTYAFHAGTPGMQGTNGLIYALLTLDAMDYPIPTDAVYTRELLVEELLELQQSDGGIGLDQSLGGDIDITAMAIQALAPYAQQPEVKNAIDCALAWLSGYMTENCTFVYYGDENVESSAQVILALCALGIDPEETELFTQGERTILDGMNDFRMKNGLYKHTKSEEETNVMSTYQALLALEAVLALRTESRWIFDLKDYTLPKSF